MSPYRKERARGPVRALAYGAAALLAVIGGLAALDRFFPPDLHRAQPSALIVQGADGTILAAHTSTDGMWRLPVAASHVDPHYVALLMATEDRRFATHPGVDLLALARASWQLARRGHVVSGGSTLAMQVARLLTPHRRTMMGKLEDIGRAMQLEWRFGRAGVLDLYLALAPQGRNIEGVRAASLLYFGHEPNHLSPEEAAILVALPRRPSAFRPDRHPAALLDAARRVNDRAGRPPVAAWQAPEFTGVPHDAQAVLDRLWSSGRRGVVVTTLDSTIQRMVRRMLAVHKPPLRGTFAAIVVDGAWRVRAWVGGAEHDCPGCLIDGVRARRSPGSTLKPFIYGMAFEDGWLTPRTRIADTRLSLGGYAPRDFDRSFRGETSVAQALQLSLNVPAIQALSRVGPAAFLNRLAENGVTFTLPHRASRAAPGLAIALGGGGIALDDLAVLYTALAHDGRVAPLHLETRGLEARDTPSVTRLLTPRAARDVRAILCDTAAPPGVAMWSGVAFKTGTSYGSRDGWAMAVAPGPGGERWTIGVWAGRPDGTAVPGVTGRGTAGPVLADIVTSLDPPAMADADVPGARHAADGALSPALRRLPRASGPQILYPRTDAIIESRQPDGTMTPIGLEVAGGVAPYRWFANGRALDLMPGAAPAWMPESSGFAHLAVVDANGRHAAVDVRVQ